MAPVEKSDYDKEIDRVVLKNLELDRYVAEGFHIISDLIKLQTK